MIKTINMDNEKKINYVVSALLLLLLGMILALTFCSFKPPKKEVDYSPVVDVYETLLDHKFFKIAYDCRHNTPVWVYYKLTKDMVIKDGGKRKDNFHNDPLLKSCDVSSSDYLNSGYDKGHIVPAEDMDFSQESMDECFVMSNMTPQNPKFNRGIWKKLESTIRNLAVEEGELYIVKGILLEEGFSTIGTNHIPIPKYCYAVMINKKLDKSWIYILENAEFQNKENALTLTIDQLEQLTHNDFFYNLPDNIESKLEK